MQIERNLLLFVFVFVTYILHIKMEEDAGFDVFTEKIERFVASLDEAVTTVTDRKQRIVVLHFKSEDKAETMDWTSVEDRSFLVACTRL